MRKISIPFLATFPHAAENPELGIFTHTDRQIYLLYHSKTQKVDFLFVLHQISLTHYLAREVVDSGWSRIQFKVFCFKECFQITILQKSSNYTFAVPPCNQPFKHPFAPLSHSFKTSTLFLKSESADGSCQSSWPAW